MQVAAASNKGKRGERGNRKKIFVRWRKRRRQEKRRCVLCTKQEKKTTGDKVKSCIFDQEKKEERKEGEELVFGLHVPKKKAPPKILSVDGSTLLIIPPAGGLHIHRTGRE